MCALGRYRILHGGSLVVFCVLLAAQSIGACQAYFVLGHIESAALHDSLSGRRIFLGYAFYLLERGTGLFHLRDGELPVKCVEMLDLPFERVHWPMYIDVQI